MNMKGESMREIKFRAWDKAHGFMRYTHDGWSEETDVLCEVFCLLKEYNYEIMQYTGLKDKNGKEIYEGDVVSLKVEDRVFNYPIIWHEDGYWAMKSGEKTSIGLGLGEMKYWQVIGNIYENPELTQERD